MLKLKCVYMSFETHYIEYFITTYFFLSPLIAIHSCSLFRMQYYISISISISYRFDLFTDLTIQVETMEFFQRVYKI